MEFIRFINLLEVDLNRGDVVVLAPNRSNHVHAQDEQQYIPAVEFASAAYDQRVCGVVHALDVHVELTSTAASPPVPVPAKKAARAAKTAAAKLVGPMQVAGHDELTELDRSRIAPGQTGLMVVLGAVVNCKVDAEIAPVKEGDLLTTSPSSGYAQKVLDPARAAGSVIGKSLGVLAKTKGSIPVLVCLQ